MSKLRITTISAGLVIMIMASLFLARHGYPATFYKYIDKNGTVCLTDSRQSIPDEYKKKAIKITEPDENEKTGKKAGDDQSKKDNEGGPLTEKEHELSSKEKIINALTSFVHSSLFGLAAAITIFLVLFILIGKVGSSLGHKQLSSVLRIALTAGLLIYLYLSYVEKIANIFDPLKKDLTHIKEKTEERNKKAEDTAKEQPGPGSTK